MAIDYITLVNRLRRRLNEVDLVSGSTWDSAVGFDQFTKDAINFAYRDIVNAELEWPFTHISATLYTVPGTQFYTATSATYTTPSGFLSELDTIDWESFYIGSNQTIETFTAETHTIPASSTYTVTVTHAADTSTITGTTRTFYLNVSVTINGISATAVTGVPLTGQYAVNSATGLYTFSSADAGLACTITYKTAALAPSSSPTPINAIKLPYVDYDFWRQNYLGIDFNAQTFGKPAMVFKTQVTNEIGISPVPDQVYNIFFEFWLDATELSNSTDVPLIPEHFRNILIDGAQKYCFEFREDMSLAQMADKRFQAGIERMRIELINRESTMNAGFAWNPLGYSYSNNMIFR